MAHTYCMKLNYIAISIAVMLLCLGAPALAAEPEQAGAQAADSGQAMGAGKSPTAATTGKGFDEKAFGKAILGKPREVDPEWAAIAQRRLECWCDKPYKECCSELSKEIVKISNKIIRLRNKLQAKVNKATSLDRVQLARLFLIEHLTVIYTNSCHAIDLLDWVQITKQPAGNHIYKDIKRRLLQVDIGYWGEKSNLEDVSKMLKSDDMKDLYEECENIIALLNRLDDEVFCVIVKIE